MGFFGDIIDSAAKFVQDKTGETERRQLLEDFKELYRRKRDEIEQIVNKINKLVKWFNENIVKLNIFRKERVGKNLYTMSNSLEKYGSVSKEYKFEKESSMAVEDIPLKIFSEIDDYIEQIDYSREEVFLNALLRTPILDRLITISENEENKARMHQYELDCNAKIEMAIQREMLAKEDVDILMEYSKMVHAICNTIENKIIPELEIIDAFFECTNVSDSYIAQLQVGKSDKDISTLVGTRYERHYTFMRNVFAFYCVAKKIYETPILTNLLAEGEHHEERKMVAMQHEVLQKQINHIEASVAY